MLVRSIARPATDLCLYPFDPPRLRSCLFSTQVLYTAFAVGTLFAPGLVNRLGLKPGLVCGTLGFTVYAASFTYPRPFTILPAAALSGLSGAMLWTAQVAVPRTGAGAPHVWLIAQL